VLKSRPDSTHLSSILPAQASKTRDPQNFITCLALFWYLWSKVSGKSSWKEENFCTWRIVDPMKHRTHIHINIRINWVFYVWNFEGYQVVSIPLSLGAPRLQTTHNGRWRSRIKHLNGNYWQQKDCWQAKYIEVDTPIFISKSTKSGILFFSRMQLVKSKANPVQAWRGPEGSRRMRFPYL